MFFSFFFFNDTATTEIYTLSLHDALPIFAIRLFAGQVETEMRARPRSCDEEEALDRKSTRLNSSHSQISYAVFCLKKKKKKQNNISHYISNKSQEMYTLSHCQRCKYSEH